MKLLIKARSHAGARPRRGAPCPKCGHSELHHHEDRLKRSMWVGPCRSCGPFQKGRCEGAQFKVEEIAKAQPKDDRGDRPEYGKVYSLGGPRSIAAGDSWQGSEVWCGGTRSDHSAYGCRAKADHEHVGPDHIRHMRGAAKINGCTPDRCGKRAQKAYPKERQGDGSNLSGRGCTEPSCPLPTANHRSTTPNFATSKDQVYVDSWRNKHRALRYKGKCVGCGSRTYAFDDGQNDPRGVLGDRHASSSETPDEHGYAEKGPEIPACFGCMNDEPRYRRVMEIAHRTWGKQVGSGGSVPDKLPKDITDMDKSAAYNPFRARVRKVSIGQDRSVMHAKLPNGDRVQSIWNNPRRTVRTQGIRWDDLRDAGNTKDRGDFAFTPKVTGKRTWQKSEPTAPKPVGKAPWARATAAPKERTNPAAVAQIKEARANKMGVITKAKPDADPYDVALLRQREFRIRQDQEYNDRINAQNEKYRAHRAANHPDEFSCPDCKWPNRAYLEKARTPDQRPPDYPDGFVTEVGRDTRICKGCGMPSGEHEVGCKGGGTEKVSDQVVKKAGVPFGTRPFARRALPKVQLTRERAGAPRYRKALACVCGDAIGSHIGEGGCGSCDCSAFVKAQPVFVLRMRKAKVCTNCGKDGGAEGIARCDHGKDLCGPCYGSHAKATGCGETGVKKAWQPDGRSCEEGNCKEVATQSTAMNTLNCDVHAMANNAYARLTPAERGFFSARRPARRRQLLGITKSESVEVPEIPKCDFHPESPAYADARLPSVGSWANVCKDCFHAHGASLGEGRGQVYMPEGRSKPQKSKSKTSCPRCAAGDFTRAKREDGLRHTATMKAPSVATVMKWDFNSNHKATDGCKVEGDGLCQHGHQSWIRRMGIM